MKNYTWATLLRFFVRITTIIRIAVLARTGILSPSEFGLFGIATIILSLLEIFTETGINVFLIQEKNPLEKYLNTAWVISIIRGAVICLFIILSAPGVANFFHSPSSLSLLYLVAFVPFARGFINPACVRFQKELHFDREFWYRLAIVIVESIVILVIAFLTHSAIAFVLGMLISTLFEVILSYIVFRPWPKFIFQKAIGLQIFHQGKWITGMGLLDYVYTTGDNIIVGRFLGQSSLGIYQNAYKLSTLPITELVNVYNTVSFPSLSKITHEPKLLKRVAIRNFYILFSLLLVASLSLYLLAYPLVSLLLGNQWLAAVPVVEALAFLGLSRGVVVGMTSLFLALKQQRYVSIIGLTSAIGLLVTIVPFVERFGIQGAAFSAMFGSLLAVPTCIYFTYKILHTLT